MPNKVYDDEDQNQRLTGDASLSGDERQKFNDIEQGYYDDESGDIANNESGGSGQAGGSSSSSNRARQLLGRERAAATGSTGARQQMGKPASGNPNITRGGLGVQNTPGSEPKIERGGFGKTAAAVKAKEEEAEGAGLFNPDKDKPKESDTKPKGRLSRKQKAGGILALFTLLGGGGLGFIASVQGPLEFIDISQELAAAHLDPMSDQGDSSMFKIMRYLRYYQQGRPERTRLGIVGNKMADKIEARFNAAGIESQYTKIGGFQKGVLIDPQKLSSGDFKQLQGKNSSEVVKFFADKYKVPVTPAGVGSDGTTRFLIDTDKVGYFKFNALTRDLMRSAGYHYLAPGISGNKMAVRGGIDLHWLKRKLNEKGKSYEERITAIEERDKASIKRDAKAPSIAATGETDKDGNPINDQGGTDATNEIGKDAADALAKDAAGDKTALSKFKAAMTSKYSFFGAGIIGLICAAYSVSQSIDTINQANVVRPLERVGMGMGVSVGDEVADGGDDVDSEHLGVLSKLNYNRTATDTVPAGDWSVNRATQANRGLPQSAPPAPGSFNVNPQGNFVTQFLGAIPGLDGLCKVANSLVGVVVLTALSFTPGAGVIKNILQLVAAGAAAQLIIGWLVDIFTANVVDPAVAGPIHGYAMEYGTHFAANDIGLTKGALPVSSAVALAMRGNSDAASLQEFQSRNLASRLFDTKDNRSFIAQVVDKNAPDPATNVAVASRGLLNISQSFGSLFTGIFAKTVSAAPVQPYNYGVPTVAWDPAQLDDPAFDNPFETGDNAADIMDGNGAANPATLVDVPNMDNYITRAKTCFGVTIFTDGVASDGKPVYALKPPVAGEEPTYKTLLDPANKCDGAQVATIHTPKGDKQIKTAAIDHDWTTVRMYINYSTIITGPGCEAGDEQSCIDSGLVPDPNAGNGSSAVSGTGVPTCGTTAATPFAPVTGYTIKNCEDFSGTSLTNGWEGYDGGGGDTVKGAPRRPDHCTVASDIFTLTQNTAPVSGLTTAGTCGASSSGPKWNQRYGYWEVKMRAYELNPGGAGSKGHPVLLLWPESGNWPQDGELDYFETDMGSPAGGFLHCASSAGGNCYDIPSNPVNYSEFRVYGLEWTPTNFTGYIDKAQWWTTSDPRPQSKVAMHQTIQLDNFDSPPVNNSKMEIDWVHMYSK